MGGEEVGSIPTLSTTRAGSSMEEYLPTSLLSE